MTDIITNHIEFSAISKAYSLFEILWYNVQYSSVVSLLVFIFYVSPSQTQNICGISIPSYSFIDISKEIALNLTFLGYLYKNIQTTKSWLCRIMIWFELEENYSLSHQKEKKRQHEIKASNETKLSARAYWVNK